jgi:hypothetical protein
MTDTGSCPDSGQLSQLRQLRVELEQLHSAGELDPYTLYVYGVVLRKLALHDLALPILCQSIQGESLTNWLTVPDSAVVLILVH